MYYQYVIIINIVYIKKILLCYISKVGGVKEKILAAYNSDIKTVIIPKLNLKDTKSLPTNIKVSTYFCSYCFDYLILKKNILLALYGLFIFQCIYLSNIPKIT